MKEVSLQSPTRRQGVIMFALLICAYIIFATNWVSGSNLSKQITENYFNGEKVYRNKIEMLIKRLTFITASIIGIIIFLWQYFNK